MIDLGLTSGLKWSSCNLGATKPEQYGTYFAFGDVIGQTWDGSKWSGGGFSQAPVSEVNSINNLKPQYDAAHVILGENWRMPTKEDIEELLANCTYAWVENYKSTGVRGALLVSKINGNSIFLPSAGIGDGSTIRNLSYYGHYWSATRKNATSAFGLWIWSTTKEIGQEGGFTSSRGYQIRPVSD